MKRLVAAIAVLACLSTGARAGSLEFDGPLVQGGLVFGMVPPGSSVVVGGKKTRVSPDGVFLVGFGRDADGPVRVSVAFPDGGTATKSLEIEKRQWKIQRIDGLPKKHVTPDPRVQKRIVRENAQIIKARKNDGEKAHFFRSGFRWPARGRISGVFGSQRILNGKPKSPHRGVDVAAPTGAPVTACADGEVALVHQDMFYTGKTVMLDHGHGLTSIYIHMSKTLVEPGQFVSAGDPIGEIGRTGRATGPHLHWGVSLFETALDPALLVDPMEPAKP